MIFLFKFQTFVDNCTGVVCPVGEHCIDGYDSYNCVTQTGTDFFQRSTLRNGHNNNIDDT